MILKCQRVRGDKIILITSEFPPQPGGIGNHASNLALALTQAGFFITVLVFDGAKDNITLSTFDALQPFNTIRLPRNRNIVYRYSQRIYYSRKLAKASQFVILSGKAPLWMQLFISKKATTVVHGSELLLNSSVLRGLTKMALRKAKNAIAVSHFTKGLLPNLLQQKTIVINNGINLSEFDLEPKAKPQQIDFVTVGTIHQRKGQHNFIAALPAILACFENCHYHIIGIDKESKAIKRQIQNLQLNNRVTIHGSLERAEMLSKLKACSIGIMLSENTGSGDVEGFGISLIEANAMGLPTLGSKGTGIEDAIRNNFNGVLVEAKNSDEIIAAITLIMNHYEQYSLNALQFARQCSWHLRVNDYIKQIEA